MTLSWYAVSLRSNHEQQARDSLTQRGIECFLPCFSRQSTRTDRTVTLLRPLFPGYLFCRIRIPGPDRITALQCRGVTRFVSLGDTPTPVADTVIESLQILTGAQTDTILPHPLLRSGQAVEVVQGPFRGAQGILTADRDGRRLVVGVELLGRAVSVPVDLSDVAPIIG